jgi:hypothetical protein
MQASLTAEPKQVLGTEPRKPPHHVQTDAFNRHF